MNDKIDSVHLLDSIPVDLKVDKIVERLRIRSENQRAKDIVRQLVESVIHVARPKALFIVACVRKDNGDTIEIGGIKLTSHVLRVGFDKIDEVYPFVTTCGRELNSIASPKDTLTAYYLDAIKRAVLTSAMQYLEAHLVKNYACGDVSRFSPGDLPSWPINQQKELFSMLGDVENSIGVKLTSSFMMVPEKSISGIFFPTEHKFESCQLCTRKCADRKAAYDIGLAKKLEAV